MSENNYAEELEKEFQKLLKELEDSIKHDVGLYEVDEISGVNLEELEKNFKIERPKQKLGYEKLHPDAVDPKYNYTSDSGFDLHSTISSVIPPLGRALIPTGIKLQIPVGYEIQVRSKSGLALKQGLMVLNSPGTVDRGYTGEIMVILFNTNQEEYHIKSGDKVAQAVLCPVMDGEVVDLIKIEKVDDGERGNNGFGSTGI
jgi:dUTP pyrophosphatase